MLSLLLTALKRLRDHRRRRAELLALLQKDDRVLRDIGLHRAEIAAAAGVPLGGAPGIGPDGSPDAGLALRPRW